MCGGVAVAVDATTVKEVIVNAPKSAAGCPKTGSTGGVDVGRREPELNSGRRGQGPKPQTRNAGMQLPVGRCRNPAWTGILVSAWWAEDYVVQDRRGATGVVLVVMGSIVAAPVRAASVTGIIAVRRRRPWERRRWK